MSDREFQYIDMDQINERIARGEIKSTDDEPVDVLYGTILDLLQLAANEGMTEEEIDAIVNRIVNYRADRCRDKFRLHMPKD
jgi:hypothetical protein